MLYPTLTIYRKRIQRLSEWLGAKGHGHLDFRSEDGNEWLRRESGLARKWTEAARFTINWYSNTTEIYSEAFVI